MKIKKFNEAFEPILNASKQQEEVELDPKWVVQDKLPMEAIQFAEFFGRYLVGPKRVEDKRNPGKQMTVFSGGLSTSQIRNFFGEVRTIQMKGFSESGSDFVMLKPRLAFAKVRAMKDNVGGDHRIKDFEKVMGLLIDEVEASGKKEHFKNFDDFFEAIVAYHKASGGKN